MEKRHSSRQVFVALPQCEVSKRAVQSLHIFKLCAYVIVHERVCKHVCVHLCLCALHDSFGKNLFCMPLTMSIFHFTQNSASRSTARSGQDLPQKRSAAFPPFPPMIADHVLCLTRSSQEQQSYRFGEEQLRHLGRCHCWWRGLQSRLPHRQTY